METEWTLQAWHWGVVCAVFLGLQIIAFEATMLWLGVVAGLVGLVVYFFPELSWVQQVLGFIVLSIVSIVSWQKWEKNVQPRSDQPLLNRRGEQMVGMHLVLDEDLTNGRSRIKIGDTTWTIEADQPFAKGSHVMVISVNSNVLKVGPCKGHH